MLGAGFFRAMGAVGVLLAVGVAFSGGERLERLASKGEPRVAKNWPMLLGEFRGVAADIAWIQAYQDWSHRDLAAMRGRLRLVAGLDPRPLVFWINGARMLGFDGTAWRVAGGEDREAVAREQLAEALSWLDAARAFHPNAVDVSIEEAVLRLRLVDDRAGAVEALSRASRQTGAPEYVGRVRAELLGQLGRYDEALEVLIWHRAELFERDPADPMLEAIDRRIGELENRLRLSAAAAK